MTFDRETRNALQRTVATIRDLLQEDVSEQLRRIGIQDDGQVLDLDAIVGLTDEERQTGEAMRTLLEHFIAAERSPERTRRPVAQTRMAREIGFSSLNRLMAIRMAEERGLIEQAVGGGYDSRGFRMYEMVANDALGGRYQTYRAYLDALSDEIAIDIPALFDRNDVRTRLFPSEQALNRLFHQLNAPEIACLWQEDETIGWVYQYYNDPEERREMRKHGAPRNSRELAVRNQFFTPRYVVEFLTDNTLGRTWYEMRAGDTRLKDNCRYLVWRPDEVFLAPPEIWERDSSVARFLSGESDDFAPFELPISEWRSGDRSESGAITMPWVDTGDAGSRLMAFAHAIRPFDWGADARQELWNDQLQTLSSGASSDPINGTTQELWDLLLAVVRADRFNEGLIATHAVALTRIANEIRRRMLDGRDPAASQDQILKAPHLVPFRAKKDPRDLLVIDPACGSGHFLLYAFDLLLTIYAEAWGDPDLGPSLQRKFRDRQSYDRQVPALILHNNLYGIDIDPRATQIAALALWLRAQRQWHEDGIGPTNRPRIRKSNIVCAEPMPGEREMLREFLGTIDVRLRTLVETIWDKMQLAGEAGALLKIEEEIRDVLAAARKEAMVDAPPLQMTMYGATPPRQQAISLATKNDIDFWRDAEQKLLDALQTYSTQASNGKRAQRRLFADDATQGFAFVDVSRTVFDVALMNPPFGAATEKADQYLSTAYPLAKNDLFAAFVFSSRGRLVSNGMLGAITSRTGLFLRTLEAWRDSELVERDRIFLMADLGHGVLDGAMVGTAAYCLVNR